MHGGFRTSTIRIDPPTIGIVSTPSTATSDPDNGAKFDASRLAAEVAKVPAELRPQEVLNILTELDHLAERVGHWNRKATEYRRRGCLTAAALVEGRAIGLQHAIDHIKVAADVAVTT